MGHAPPPPARRLPSRLDPRLWPQHYIDELLRRKRYRFSWFPWRRRSAYAALREVIRWREAVLWPEPESRPPPAPPRPLSPTYTHR